MPPELRKILFVDDQREVLDAMRTSLHRQRRVWSMRFANSGAEAVTMLTQERADAVVSDMRMPGMNGAELLMRVRDMDPQSLRFVLSGHAEEEIAIQALAVAHQWLSKPCPREVLISSIERALHTRDLVKDDSLRQALGKVQVLPSVPYSYSRLVSATSSGENGLEIMVRIAEEDPAFAARVLQLANSAFYGLQRQLTSIREAITHLGFRTLSNLVLLAEILTTFCMVDREEGFSLERFQLDARVASRLAYLMCQDTPIMHVASSAALLHDIGRLILHTQLRDEARAARKLMREQGLTLHEAERAVVGVGHAQVGAALLDMWGLPVQIVEAVALHHDLSSHSAVGLDAVPVVHAAAYLSEIAIRERWSAPDEQPVLDSAGMARCGLEGLVDTWMDRARVEVERCSAEGSSDAA